MKSKATRSVLTSKIETEIDLLQRHVAMLKAIMDNEPIGIIRLAEMLKYPEDPGFSRPSEGDPRVHEQYGQ
jgi:hypothetical protein